MSLPKFNFIPEKQLNEEFRSYTPAMVTLAVTKTTIGINYQLRFMSETVRIYELDGKYITMYADEQKRAIGWRFIDGKTDLPELSGAKQLKVNTGLQASIGVGKLLKSAKLIPTKTLSGLEVKKHLDPLNKYEIFYIEIPREKVEDKGTE